jgi:hypothetical protein
MRQAEITGKRFRHLDHGRCGDPLAYAGCGYCGQQANGVAAPKARERKHGFSKSGRFGPQRE